jgi:hypothetical protein
MQWIRWLFPPLVSVCFSCFSWADCLPFIDARNHVGEIRCISGRVLRIEQGDHGVHFLEFCQDHELCPFTVVIFANSLRSVGDVRQLVGKIVEIHGTVKLYDGRAEIILEHARQLSGDSVEIPPLPKNYDVENKGHYSAGKFSRPHAPRSVSKKRQTAKLPIDIPADISESSGPTP